MSSLSALNSLLNSGGDTSDTSNGTTGTDGINLSSILAATSGNTAALDVTSAVAAAIYADRAPERVWQGDQTTLSTQNSDLQKIQSATEAVNNDLEALNNLTGPLSSRTATSSSSVVAATAASGTSAGVHTVQVSSLATTASWYSASESSATTTLSAGSVTITGASGSTQTFSTGSGTPGDNLNHLASAVNAANLGVTASVVNDAGGSRLAIIANTSGSAANFSVTSTASGFGFSQAGLGANASLTVDGIPISSASNTVTGAISGVTLTLSGTTTTAATITVSSNTSSITDAINQFVTDYNDAIDLVNAQYSESSEGTEGVLSGDSTINNLQGTLEQAVSYVATPASGTTTSVSSLANLGITVNQDGTLDVNSTTLNSVLSVDPSDVQNFFQGSSLNGFANTFSTSLNVFTDASTGAFTLDLSGISAEYSDLSGEINDFETNYIATQQTALTTEYNNAEAALQALPNEIKDVQAELGQNNGSSGS